MSFRDDPRADDVHNACPPVTKKHIYYVDAVVTTPVKLRVVATNENEAFSRAMDGAWHGCDPEPRSWDKAKVTHVGPIVKGPGIS